MDEDEEDEDEGEINEDESIWKNEEEWMDSNKFQKMLEHRDLKIKIVLDRIEMHLPFYKIVDLI